MAIHEEIPHRGIWNVIDPAFAPEGSLTVAGNSRYRPGDPALWQAEGRYRVGSTNYDEQKLYQVGFFGWDPPRRPEFIYFEHTMGIVRRIPAATDPTDPRFAFPDSVINDSEADMGSLAWEVVALPTNEFVLLDGAEPKVVRPVNPAVASSDVKIDPLGVPLFRPGVVLGDDNFYGSMTATLVQDAAGTFNEASEHGGYHYWVTFVTPRGEGSAPTAGVTLAMPTPLQIGLGYRIDVTVTLPDLGLRPYDLTSIKLYRNLAPTVVTPTVAPAFPTGIHIFSAVVVPGTDTYTFKDGLPIGSSPGATVGGYLPFEAVFINAAGKATGTGRDAPPPVQVSCGDVFQESLVLNDISNPRKIVFSYPGRFGSFPSTFFLTIAGEAQDRVKAIKSMGRQLGVFTENALWRINWLPSQSDFDFGRGNVLDLVSSANGIRNPAAVARVQMNEGTVLAFANEYGLWMTDLVGVKLLSGHVDWPTMGINPATVRVVNNPKEFRIEVWTSSTIWYFHYHDVNMASGVMPVTGPMTRSGGAGVVVPFYDEVGKFKVLSSDNVGGLFYEGIGFDEASTGAEILMSVETREIYALGRGREFQTDEFFAHVKPAPFINANYSIVALPGPDTAGKPLSITLGDRGMLNKTAVSRAEYVKFAVGGAGAVMAVNSLGFVYSQLTTKGG